MRICSPQLGISPDSNLGGEVHDREMLKSLADLGVEIDIILPFGKKHEAHKNWHFYYLLTPIVFPPIVFNALVLPHLFWIYFRHKFNILRVHSPYFVGLGALIFKLVFPRILVIAHYHHFEGNKVYNLIDSIIANKFDLIVTASNVTKSKLINKFGVLESKIAIIPYGVSASFAPQIVDQQIILEPANTSLLCSEDEQAPRRNSEPKIPRQPFRSEPQGRRLAAMSFISKYKLHGKKPLLYIGQLISRKNIPFLLQVVKALPEEYILLIAGDGPLKNQLQDIVRSLQLDNRVTFCGHISEEEKPKMISLADFFLFSSSNEGFGLSVLEAMACGKIVIAAKLPVFQQFIDTGRNGFLLDLDSQRWVKTILSLDHKPQTKRSLEKNARQSAKKFSWNNFAKTYLRRVNHSFPSL